jgi:hypothetical protein
MQSKHISSLYVVWTQMHMNIFKPNFMQQVFLSNLKNV